MSEHRETFEGWVILELMGHRRLGGYLTEQEMAGGKFLRIDVPTGGGEEATQFYSPSAVYCITPTSVETARAVALRNRPAPVAQWELPAPAVVTGYVPESEPACSQCGHLRSDHRSIEELDGTSWLNCGECGCEAYEQDIPF